jgi:hypothetical protein
MITLNVRYGSLAVIVSDFGQELTLTLWVALSGHAQALNRSRSGILVANA